MKYLCSALLVLLPSTCVAQVRTWACKDRSFKIKGEVVAFNDTTVVLKKEDKNLVAIELNELCEEDLKYFQTEEARKQRAEAADAVHTWTGIDGLKVPGTILEYGRKVIKVQRRRGKVYVDNKLFENMDGLHQKVILKVLSKLENQKIEDGKQLIEWSKKLGGQGKEYTLSGVLLELESGDTIGVPFFMFAPQDREILRPGWQAWLQQQESEEAQDRESFLMRSAALAYQQDRAMNRNIEMLKLDLLATTAGVTQIWKVALIPNQGHWGRPTTVMVTARDSSVAAAKALRAHPGYTIGGISRASR